MFNYPGLRTVVLRDMKQVPLAPILIVILAGIYLIVMKVLGKLDWQWMWILSPLWMLLLLVIAIIAFTRKQ